MNEGEHFFELLFQSQDFTLDSRDEVEDVLDEALTKAGVSEVTGAGWGAGMMHLDVEATDFEAALAIIRQILKGLSVAPSTKIHYHCEAEGSGETYSVYD